MRDIDEPIEIIESQPDWPAMFDREAATICRALGLYAVAVEHIGSTAVPGLVAKPVIDIQVGVAGVPNERECDPLTELGYEGFGAAGVPGRLYYRKRANTSYNVHVVEHGGEHWRANLAIRDYLRTHPGVAAEYAACKRAVVDSGAVTLLAYSERKGRFVGALVRQAVAWTQDESRTDGCQT